MSRLVGDEAVERAAVGIRGVFSQAAPGTIGPAAVQPLTPYLEFMGEAYRDKLVPYGTEDGKDLCLRPDITLAIALDIVAGLKPVESAHYDTLIFRAARRSVPEASRHAPIQRQIGFEFFDETDEAKADLDLFVTSVEALKAAGLHNPRVTISDTGLFFALIDSLDVHENWKSRLKSNGSNPTAFAKTVEASLSQTLSPSALSKALSGVSQEESRAAVEEIFAMAGMEAIGTRSLDNVADRLVTKAFEANSALQPSDAELLSAFEAIDEPLTDALDGLEERFSGQGDGVAARIGHLRRLGDELSTHGVDLRSTRFDANLARGLNYYDGIIFELHSPDGQIFLGGGGRYDRLLSDLSGGRINAPALGAMLRPDRVASSLEAA